MRKINLFLLAGLFVIVGVWSVAPVSAQRGCTGGQIYVPACGACVDTTRLTGDCSSPTGGIYICGSCVCPPNTMQRTVAGSDRCIAVCGDGQIFNAAAGECKEIVILNPSSAAPQSGYLSVTGVGDAAAAPEGALYFNTETNSLRVRTDETGDLTRDWQPVTGTTYTAGRNINVTDSLISVLPNPTFDGEVTVGNNLRIRGGGNATGGRVGDLYMTAGQAIRVDSPDSNTVFNIGNFAGRGTPLTTNFVRGTVNVERNLQLTGTSGGAGDMYLNSGKAIRLDVNDAPSTLLLANYGTDDVATERRTDMRVTLHAGKGALSELVLQQGIADKWSLSLRPNANFELWRNAGGEWVDAPLQISNSNGLVYLPNKLVVGDDTLIQGGRLTLGAGSQNLVNSSATRLPAYLRIQQMDVDSGSGNPEIQDAITVVDEEGYEWFGVRRTGYDLAGGGDDSATHPPVEVRTAGKFVAPTAEFTALTAGGSGPTVNIQNWRYASLSLGGDLTASRSAVIGSGASSYTLGSTPAVLQANARYNGLTAFQDLLRLNTFTDAGAVTSRFAVDRNGNITATGRLNATGGMTQLAIDNVNTEAISESGNGLLRVGNVSGVGGASVYLRFDQDEISSYNTTLNINQHGAGGGLYPVRVHSALDVDGIITAGSGTNAYPLTNSSGGLKMAELANEDWGSLTNPKGTLMFGVDSQSGDTLCSTVCSNHGLNCRGVIIIGAYDQTNRTAAGSCGSASGTQGFRLCACGS